MAIPMEFNAGSEIQAVTFSANGEYLVSGDKEAVRMWRVQDGEQVATMAASGVWCLAVSQDGRWIAAGTAWDGAIVWNAATRERVLKHGDHHYVIRAVDFAPNSTRLVVASTNNTVIVDVAARNQVRILCPKSFVVAAKYSPQGDRVATATQDGSVRVWDSNDGRLLVHVKVKVAPYWNKGLLWLKNHLFVASDDAIKQFDASTGFALSEWPISDSDKTSCITLSQHAEFIAYSAKRTVMCWDTSTRTELGIFQQPQDIRSVALSPDDRYLATAADGGKVTIQSLFRITDAIPLSRVHPTLQEPDLQINGAVLDLWKDGQLGDAEAMLTSTILESRNSTRHLFAGRALVRARLQKWDASLADAEMAIKLQPSVIGYIAKSIAHVGLGEMQNAYQACDVAFERFHSSHGTFLLLVKAIIVCMSGEYHDAISRVDNLIAKVHLSSVCYLVQAYMYLLLGNSQTERGDYDGAIQSFEHARTKMQYHGSRSLPVVSLIFGWKFDAIGIMIPQGLCEALYAAGRTEDAVECFRQISSEFGEGSNLDSEHLEKALDFRQRFCTRFEQLGDTAMNARRYDEAISHFTSALSINPLSPRGIFVKRNGAFMAAGSWEQALDDANEVIELDPSSPLGYEMKHAALHKSGDYTSAVEAFETMLSRIEQSTDQGVQQYGDRYVSPSSVRATIHQVVQRTIRNVPRVLVNTSTGRLHDKAEQASAFESASIFNELVSSMTLRIDYVRIKREVRKYFRYVMLSHKWEDHEPLFQHVLHVAVYDLDKSPTHDKLQTFCRISRDAGFNWAWSDTCCINKSDHFVLQEALVAMFKWYRDSALMIVFLRGVSSSSQPGALVSSIWNTRAWTLQEYVASKTIHFYTEDWTLYLDLKLPNHKASPEVITEMEQATGVSARHLRALHPGLTGIREKLRLASTRQTTLVEDAAYSLLGIFSVTGIPAIYGEGEGSLGRLLAHVLTGSGDVSILAWNGDSGSFNSCLPAQIAVFKGPAASHLPPPVQDAETERTTTGSHPSAFDPDVAMALYDRLNELSPPWFAANRMKLPCIAFLLPPLSRYRARSGRVYRVETVAFGTVEIKTRHDLSRMNSLYLIHPWLDTLLEREDKSNVVVEEDVLPSPNADDEEISDKELDGASGLPEHEWPSHAPPVRMVSLDKETRARRLVARLRQPFGALLVTLTSAGGRAVDYKRVAADSLITVRFQDEVSLDDILNNVCTLDVL